MSDTIHDISHAKVVTIGGGTGSFTLLGALKHHFVQLTAIVTMADDGGSTGQLRDELGVLPPGDIRQCLVALSDDAASKTLRDLFNFRFQEGSLAGHSFGNLFLSAVEKMTDDFDEAIDRAGEILKIHGRIVPITHDNVRLAIRWGDEVVRGEGNIDTMDFGARQSVKPTLFLEPHARINHAAAKAIEDADLIVVCPGDIYTSLGALLVVDGVKAAFDRTKAKVVYVCNLVVNPRQTKDWTVTDHAAELERLVGSQFIDYVLYNDAVPSPQVLERYIHDREDPVKLAAGAHDTHYRLVGGDLVGAHIPQITPGDKLANHRSYFRHDGEAVSHILLQLLSA